MGLVKKLIPLLEIDFGSKKLFYSSESMKIRDGDSFKQYEGKIKSEGGISRSFSLEDFRASVTVASNVTFINDGNTRFQDSFNDYPEAFNSIRMAYLAGNDTTALIDDIYGVASDPSWDNVSFSMNIKDSQKLRFNNVPNIIFDEKTFQTSVILTDATTRTRAVSLGNPVLGGGTIVAYTAVGNIASSSFGGKPENYWKGSRVDVIMDQRASDDTNNLTGQFAIVVRSADSTVFFNTNVDNFLVETRDGTTTSILNNTMLSRAGNYNPQTLTFQCIRNAVPQNADSLGKPLPIIYGAVEKIPMIWAVGQKSTRTNSFGVGDDIYLFAGHKCKLGVIPDTSLITQISSTDPRNGATANNRVWTYRTSYLTDYNDSIEISDGLRVEVYWSLEDKRVVDAKVNPGNKNWIPNPFPKRWPGSGSDQTGAQANNLRYRDHSIRLVSPLHRVRLLRTLKGESVQAVQLRGGEFDWFDLGLINKFETRAQYPVRYGMGNSKLYISAEGYQDDPDGFYTGNQISFKASFNDLIYGIRPEEMETQGHTTLIKNPADVLLHFIVNYSSVNKNRKLIDLESFRKSRQMLEGWRIDTAITDIIPGEQFVDRICSQCCSIVIMEKGRFKMKTVIPSKLVPKITLVENIHFSKQKFEFTKTEDIYNSMIFYYKYDYVHNNYSAVIRRDKKNNDDCAKSVFQNGFEKEKSVVELRDIFDDYTANQLADVYANIFSKRRIKLSCDVQYMEEVVEADIQIGDCISITSSLAPGKWDKKECIVLETRKFSNKMELSLIEK